MNFKYNNYLNGEYIKKKASEFKSVLISVGLFLTIHYFIGIGRFDKNILWLFVYGVLILFAYYSVLQLIVKMDEFNSKHLLFALFLFFVLSLLLVGAFSLAWLDFNLFACVLSDTSLCGSCDSIDSAFYFSTVAFTTIGFGDYIPIGSYGRLLLSFEGIVGITHSTAFLSIVLLKLKQTQKISKVF